MGESQKSGRIERNRGVGQKCGTTQRGRAKVQRQRELVRNWLALRGVGEVRSERAQREMGGPERESAEWTKADHFPMK